MPDHQHLDGSSKDSGRWAKGIVARIDAAHSEEGFGVQMMIVQPLQFYPSVRGNL
jgi:hypothetical protein